jgi:archaetidylinositol phosphate synthase
MLAPYLRQISAQWTNGTGAFIGRRRFSPNLFTLTSLLWALVAAYPIYKHAYLIASLFVLITGIWDGIDGSIARAQGKSTGFGNYLDAMIDKYVEVVIYSGFALSGYPLQAFCVISGSLILSYAKPRAAIVTTINNHDWPAIGDRADRFALLLVALILTKIYPHCGRLSTLSLMLYVISVVVYIGGIQRVLYAKKLIEQNRFTV